MSQNNIIFFNCVTNKFPESCQACQCHSIHIMASEHVHAHLHVIKIQYFDKILVIPRVSGKPFSLSNLNFKAVKAMLSYV